MKLNSKPVIICIGSDKVSGDMLGPLTGTILKEEYKLNTFIYGTLSRPVNGLNLNKYLSLINNIHKDSVIISIDAAVGVPEDLYKVKVRSEGVNAGAALGMSKQIRGIGIVGIVATTGGNIISNLLSASYNIIDNLSHKIADIIYNSINQVEI